MKPKPVVAIALLTRDRFGRVRSQREAVMRPPDDKDFDDLLQRLDNTELKRRSSLREGDFKAKHWQDDVSLPTPNRQP